MLYFIASTNADKDEEDESVIEEEAISTVEDNSTSVIMRPIWLLILLNK